MRIKLFESFKDNWPPCGPFSSMEEVDKVCDELRDMFVEFVDAGHYIKVQVFPRGIEKIEHGPTIIKTDGRYTISVILVESNPDSTGWNMYNYYNTSEVSDSVMMACDYMRDFYDFDIDYEYYLPKRRADIGFRTRSSKDFPQDTDVLQLCIEFKEKL
jgi:hypothetical protein